MYVQTFWRAEDDAAAPAVFVASAANAMEAVARWTLAHADEAAWDGPELPSPEERRTRTERIQAIGRELQDLARDYDALPTYSDFETRLRALHKLGVFTDERLVSVIAQAHRDSADHTSRFASSPGGRLAPFRIGAVC